MNLRDSLVACAVLASSGASSGCSHASGTIELVTDDEAGTFTQDPVPTILQISEVSYLSDGGVSTMPLVRAALPVTSIDLGNQSQNTQTILTVTGFSADGGAVIFGASVPLFFGSLNGDTIPIFVQRTGQFARLPGTLFLPDGGADTRASPVLAVFNADFLLVAGGDQPGNDDAGTGGDAGAPPLSETTQIYDFSQLVPYSAPPTMPQPVQSIGFDGTLGYLFDADAGSYFDFANSSQGAISLPDGGGSFADLAGGATIVDPATGNEYIVGATRTSGSPSQYVQVIEPADAGVGWITLGTARLGATAVWLPSQNALAIVGGNTASDAGAGVEVIYSGNSVATPLPFPADLTTGAGAVVLNNGLVLLAGGIIPGSDAGSGVDAAASDGNTAQASDAGVASGSDASVASADASVASGEAGLPGADSSSSMVSDAGVDSGANTAAGSPTATGLRTIDLNCQSSCTPMPWAVPDAAAASGPSLPVVLVDAQAFTADGVNVLIVGNDASGATQVFMANSSSITRIPTRGPHTHARAVISPTQTVLVVGGSPFIESFTPVPY